MSAYKTNLLKEWKSVETHLDFSEWVITRLEEEEQRNELFGDCLHRGLKLWQEANPDKDYWISGDANIKWMLDQIAALRERVAGLETLLKKTEFSQHDDVKDDYFCEFCSGYSETGHNDNCELAAALKGE